MAGIWIDRVNSTLSPRPPRLVLGTKGAHLAVRLPTRYAGHGISVLNSRMEPHYVVPGRAGLHHIGPTETVYEGDLDEVRATREDVEFLIAETARALPGLAIDRSKVLFTWAGVRPLTYHADAPKGMRARTLHRLDGAGMPALLAMTAGPIMGHRSAAAEVVAAVRARIAPTRPPAAVCHTPRVPAENQNSPRLVGPADPTTLDDLVHGLRCEHARGLADLLLRRTGLVWTGLIDEAVVARAAQVVGDELGWSERERAGAVRAFLAELHRTFELPASRASSATAAAC